MMVLSDEEVTVLAATARIVDVIEGSVLDGKPYWTHEELEDLIVNVRGQENWDLYRENMGVGA